MAPSQALLQVQFTHRRCSPILETEQFEQICLAQPPQAWLPVPQEPSTSIASSPLSVLNPDPHSSQLVGMIYTDLSTLGVDEVELGAADGILQKLCRDRWPASGTAGSAITGVGSGSSCIVARGEVACCFCAENNRPRVRSIDEEGKMLC